VTTARTRASRKKRAIEGDEKGKAQGGGKRLEIEERENKENKRERDHLGALKKSTITCEKTARGKLTRNTSKRRGDSKKQGAVRINDGKVILSDRESDTLTEDFRLRQEKNMHRETPEKKASTGGESKWTGSFRSIAVGSAP